MSFIAANIEQIENVFGLAVLAACGYGYLEGHRAGFLKGVRAAERKREEGR